MSDTVDLLEAIGRDASLRHAKPEELARTLENAEADPILTAAVANGEVASLGQKLGYAHMQSTQVIVVPAHEEQEDEGDRKEDDEDEERHDEARRRA